MNNTLLNKGSVVFLVLFAIFISLVPSVNRAIWFDESASILISLRDVSEIPETVKINEGVGPLHHFLLHYWQKISLSIPWMRFLTAIFFSLSVLLIFHITKQRHSISAAVVAGVIFVLNTPQSGLYDIRFYSLSTFLGLLSTYLFLRCVDKHEIKNWVMYSISIALCLYQFYFLYFIVIIHALYYFVIKKFKIRHLKRIFLANVFAFILFIPWIPAVIYQFFEIQEYYWIAKPTLISLLKEYMVLDGVQVLFWVLLVFAFFGFYKAKMSFIVKKKVFLLSLFFLPPIALFIMAYITQPLLYGRYLQVFYPYLFILMGIGYFNMHRKIKMLVGLFLVVLVVVISGRAIIGLNQTDTYHLLQRGCLSLSQEPSSTLIVHNTPFLYFPCRYYLLGKPVNQAIYSSSGFPYTVLGNLLEEEGNTMKDLSKITELDYSSIIFFEKPGTKDFYLYYNSPEFLEIYSYVGDKMFGQIKVTKFNRNSKDH